MHLVEAAEAHAERQPSDLVGLVVAADERHVLVAEQVVAFALVDAAHDADGRHRRAAGHRQPFARAHQAIREFLARSEHALARHDADQQFAGARHHARAERLHEARLLLLVPRLEVHLPQDQLGAHAEFGEALVLRAAFLDAHDVVAHRPVDAERAAALAVGSHGIEQLGAEVHRRAPRAFAVDRARAQERLQQVGRLAQLVVELFVDRDVEVRATAAQAEVLALRRAAAQLLRVVVELVATLRRAIEEARRARAGAACVGTAVGTVGARA